jgi:cupin fold WbuC family metalloprotein
MLLIFTPIPTCIKLYIHYFHLPRLEIPTKIIIFNHQYELRIMKHIDAKTIQDLCQMATKSPRLRSHHNIHDDLNEDIQRLLIGLQPGTYIHPHIHPEDYKKEMIILLQGSCTCLTFDKKGKITTSTKLSTSAPVAEFPDKEFHSIICTSENTIVLEVKKGPYRPLEPSCFADWAPKEGSPQAEEYIKSLLKGI